ncbi:MAG: hypothetical protein OXC05_07030 [Halieaceae bacterium]|nr:hypothetical protein [Halieaceae bacterium]
MLLRPQRGALNLSVDGSRLYVTLGEPGGWIVAVDTGKARVASTFSSSATDDELVMGGIWASGGPSADDQGFVNQARSRSTLAYFRDEAGGNFMYVTGAAKTGQYLQDSAPPGLARLQIVTEAGKPAYMRVTHVEMTQTLHNAASPVVTSNGGRNGIVWVLDTNGKRSAPVQGVGAPLAVLYAFDATNLTQLWKSAPGQLATTGKYNEAISPPNSRPTRKLCATLAMPRVIPARDGVRVMRAKSMVNRVSLWARRGEKSRSGRDTRYPLQEPLLACIHASFTIHRINDDSDYRGIK